jgi:fluoroquinolone transport system permease protein
VTRPIKAFAANDLRAVGRDPLLTTLLSVPWLMVVGVRLVVPAVTAWLATEVAVDLTTWYPLIASLFFVLQLPLVFGALAGLLVLDERDDGTLTALRVTPVTPASLLAYRGAAVAGLSAVFVAVCLPLSGLAPPPLPALLPVALLASLGAPLTGLLLVAFAANKVEGLALVKGLGVLMVGPAAAFFTESPWQLLAGVLPTYWAAKAYWQASAGGATWPFLLAGLVCQALLITWFARRATARL